MHGIHTKPLDQKTIIPPKLWDSQNPGSPQEPSGIPKNPVIPPAKPCDPSGQNLGSLLTLRSLRNPGVPVNPLKDSFQPSMISLLNHGIPQTP